jgi:hypothetical protein
MAMNLLHSDLEDGEKFFMMLCDKPLFTCREKFKDGWQNEWEAGDWLLRGVWYHQKRKNSRTFILLDTFPYDFCYSHLVLCAKFSMSMIVHRCKGTIPTYTLKQEVEKTILQALAD